MKTKKWYKAVCKPRPKHVREAVSKAQKGRKHQKQEGFQKGHKAFNGTKKTRFKKGHISWNFGKENPSAKKHGMWRTNFYRRWLAINQRCNNKNSSAFKDYGGRGIRCEWKTFEEFKKFMYETYLIHKNQFGEQNTTLERINNNGNYSTENCTWITRAEQMRNRRNNRMITFNGVTKCHADWANYLGIKWCSLQKRIKNHGIEKALTMVKK